MLIFRLLLISLSIILHFGCNVSYKKKEISHIEKKLQDSLAFELCRIYGSDQGIRDKKLVTKKGLRALEISPHLDSINFYKMIDFVEKYGFPTKKLLGKENITHECVKMAFYAVLLHTPHILVNNKDYLDIFLNEIEKGNLKMEVLLLVLDKYYVIRRDEFGNRKVLYGSQFGKPCKKYRGKSDSVRAEIGLPPLPDSMFIDCKTAKKE